MQYLLALILYIQLVNSSTISFIGWVIASIGAASALFFIDHPNWVQIRAIFVYPVGIYITAILLGPLFNRNSEIVRKEKNLAASAIGTSIAHELRTPLASIRNLAGASSRNLQELARGYTAAVEAELIEPGLTRSQQEKLGEALERIDKEIQYSNTIIDMLLVSTADMSLSNLKSEAFSAVEMVEEAVKRFPFNNSSEKKSVSISVESDFQILGPKILFVHIIFNLVKNSLVHGKRSDEFGIQIDISKHGERGVISVLDTGGGVSALAQKRIFDRFYTTTYSGQSAGIGLSFCVMVMDSVKGSIRCESDGASYTKMILDIPVVEELPA